MRDTADLVLLTGAVDETGEVAQDDPVPERSANVAPTDPVRVLLRPDGRRVLRRCRWGLVPSWSKDAAGAARMINARVETVADKPAYRRAVRTARCVLPADGWYEWQRTDAPAAAASGAGRPTRTPYLVQRADGQPLWLAGIWTRWHPPGGGEPVVSAAVLTGPAPSELQWLHERAPLCVPDRMLDTWLDSDGGDPQPALDTLVSVGYPPLAWHPVSREIGQVRVKGAHLMAPAGAGSGGPPVALATSGPDAAPLALF